jgi:drug/metabolite transporter (DMT)-like permease
VNVITAKHILGKIGSYVWTLTLCQMTINQICARVYLGKLKPLTRDQRRLAFAGGLTTYLGFICTNKAFSVMNASLVETVKASEPVAGIIISFLLTTEGWPSHQIVGSLAVVVVGVMMASYADASFIVFGVLCTLGSNTLFSCGNVCSKLNHELAEPLDGMTYWYADVSYGIWFALACALPWEIRSLYNGDVIVEDLQAVVPLVLLNGLAFWLYNSMMYCITKYVEFATFQVLNTIRRGVLITATMFYFHQECSTLNLVGLGITSVGFVLFIREKVRQAEVEHQKHNQASKEE